MSDMAALTLDARIDARRLAPLFARHGRLHLPGLFKPGDARRIGEALAGPVPWSRSFNVGDKSYDLAPETLAAMPPARRAELDAAVAAGGRGGFQYRFDAWRLSDLIEAGERPGGALAALTAVYDFLNSPAFLQFVRVLTGETRPTYADAQATRYRAGDFLTVHDDDVAGKNRLLAYVLNFTPAWRADWGGVLLFHGPDGQIEEGYAPAFNALNIFAVPRRHAVSEVASFVGASRLSVTGWIRAR
jgi:SM-20-related protein